MRRRTNLLWGVVLLATALVLLLHALDVIPAGIFDLLARAWPTLLVLAGLSILLRERVPFGSLLALVLSGLLVSGVVVAAFSARSTQERSDYQESIAQEIGADVTLLEISVEALATDVEVLRSLDRAISGQFTGSSESRIQVEYTEGEDGRGIFRVVETQPNAFPMLEALGRGRLRLEIPGDIPLDLAYHGADGSAIFTLSDMALERLNIVQNRGDILVTLPAYAPLSPTAAQQPGSITARNGNVTVFVPPDVAARFELDRGGSGIAPQFDDAVYNYLVGDVLEAKTFEGADVRLRYTISAPRGVIRISATAE